MSDVLRCPIDAFKASLNLSLLLRYGLSVILSAVVWLLLFLLFFGTALWAIMPPFLEKIALLDGSPSLFFETAALFAQNLPFILTVFLVASLLFFVLSTLWRSAISAMQLALARDFLSNGRISFWGSWSKAMQRVFPLFKANLLIGLSLLVLFFVLMLPVVFSAISVFSQIPSLPELMLEGENSPFLRSIDSLFNLFNELSSLYTGVTFFLSPFLFMLAPAIVFEKQGAMYGLRRAWRLSKSSYFSNLAFVLIVGLIEAVVCVVALIACFLLFLIALVLMFLVALVALVFGIAALALFLLLLFWLAAYNSTAAVKFYEFANRNAARGH